MTKTVEFEGIIEALNSLAVEGDEGDRGMTSEEIAAALQVNQKKALQIIRVAVAEGKLRVGRRTINRDWDGQKRHYQIYCLQEGGE